MKSGMIDASEIFYLIGRLKVLSPYYKSLKLSQQPIDFQQREKKHQPKPK